MNIKKPYVTYGIMILNVILFLVMFFYDPKLSYGTMVKFGAKVNFRIVDLKLWHLITPAFLHGSLQHLIFNTAALFYFAPMIENWFGHIKFVFIYLALAMIASMGSFIFTPNVALGASGVIYGMMAFHLYLYLLNKDIYLQIFGNGMVALIVVNLLYSFVVPNIDIAGHLVGFVGGVIVFFMAGRKIPRIPQRMIATLLIIPLLLGFGYRFVNYKNSEAYFMSKGAYLYETEQFDKLQELDKAYQKYLNP